MSLIKTQEQFDKFDASLKDMLCREYRWIEKTIAKDDHTYVKSFDAEAVMICCAQIEITGRCSQKYADTFVANIDKIKNLVNEQPIITVELTLGWVNDEGIEQTQVITETYQSYSKDKQEMFINGFKDRRLYKSHKII